MRQNSQRLIRAYWELEKPVVAAVNGSPPDSAPISRCLRSRRRRRGGQVHRGVRSAAVSPLTRGAVSLDAANRYPKAKELVFSATIAGA